MSRKRKCPKCGASVAHKAILAIRFECGTVFYDRCQGELLKQSEDCIYLEFAAGIRLAKLLRLRRAEKRKRNVSLTTGVK